MVARRAPEARHQECIDRPLQRVHVREKIGWLGADRQGLSSNLLGSRQAHRLIREHAPPLHDISRLFVRRPGASVALTLAQRAQIDKTAKARETREDYEVALAAFKAEFYAKKKRVARAERTEEQKVADCKSSEKRSKKAKEVQAERRREVGIGPLLPGSRVVDVEHAMPAPAPAPANASEAQPGPAAVSYLVAMGMANK